MQIAVLLSCYHNVPLRVHILCVSNLILISSCIQKREKRIKITPNDWHSYLLFFDFERIENRMIPGGPVVYSIFQWQIR